MSKKPKQAEIKIIESSDDSNGNLILTIEINSRKTIVDRKEFLKLGGTNDQLINFIKDKLINK